MSKRKEDKQTKIKKANKCYVILEAHTIQTFYSRFIQVRFPGVDHICIQSRNQSIEIITKIWYKKGNFIWMLILMLMSPPFSSCLLIQNICPYYFAVT